MFFLVILMFVSCVRYLKKLKQQISVSTRGGKEKDQLVLLCCLCDLLLLFEGTNNCTSKR